MGLGVNGPILDLGFWILDGSCGLWAQVLQQFGIQNLRLLSVGLRDETQQSWLVLGFVPQPNRRG
jgi:hypothetical protein